MIFLNMPIVIVEAFLLLTLVVGIYFSRQKTTFREYAVGNKNFSTATLVATVLATMYGGGGLIRNVECVHNIGLWWIFFCLLGPLGAWLIGRLSLRMGPFMQHLSIAETIGSIYGKYPRIVAALVGTCVSIVGITIQIRVMSQTISTCMNIDNSCMISVISTLLLIFYSTFGGVRAVTYTDVLQFITFSVMIPLLSWFMFKKIGKPFSEIVPMLQEYNKFKFDNLFQFNINLLSLFLLILSCIVSYIRPSIVQRVYMSSGPIQAQKVFSYVALFDLLIVVFIILVGLFVFSSAPSLQKEEVWDYIMVSIPASFKSIVCIGLLAMTMSTADSCLNSCSVMVSNDILKSIQKEKIMSDANQLKIARYTTLVVGLCSMFLTFYCTDLLQLMHWSLTCVVPIVTAPFILIIFGFRGTTRTALIGMATGVLCILSWNKWVKLIIDIDGTFVSMLANGLAMMVAHYLLRQPEDIGWVKPDNTVKQIQQEHSRVNEERRETIKNYWSNKKSTLVKLVPSRTTMVCMGLYFCITSLLAYFMVGLTDHIFRLIFNIFGSACCLGYPFLYDISTKIRAIPKWFVGLVWIIVLVFYLPFNILLRWWNPVNPIFSLFLYLAHLSTVLCMLPTYIGIGVTVFTSLLSIYPVYIGLSYTVLFPLFPLFLGILCVFSIIIYLKIKVDKLTKKIIYLKNQEKTKEYRQLKSSLYEAAMVPSNNTIYPIGHSPILEQAIHKVEESISFLDKQIPLFKEDFQSIFNKLYNWVAFFRKREQNKKHALLQPIKTTFNNLIRKVEVALSQYINDPPKILVEEIKLPNKSLSIDIVCDINQVVYSLAKSVLRVGKLDTTNPPIINIQLHPTSLQFKEADSIDDDYPIFMDLPATALLISESTTSSEKLPKIKACYNEMDAIDPKAKKDTPPSIDLEKDTIASMARAHYGYFKFYSDNDQSTILIVLPNDISEIRNKMTYRLPIDALTVETPVSPKEQADSVIELMKFHDHLCKSSCQEDPIDLSIISSILLLLREHFGLKRHESGQLFYVRAVGISKLVIDWVFHSPKVVYASLLYGLVRHTCLPLSYIKQHYNLGVYAFVLNVVGIDKREELDHPSLLYVKNRLKQSIKKDHVQLSVLFIKLAEQLYDLRQAESYINPKEVQHMAQETLAIDVQIAYTYLDPEIAQALEKAAKQALEVCKNREKEKNS